MDDLTSGQISSLTQSGNIYVKIRMIISYPNLVPKIKILI